MSEDPCPRCTGRSDQSFVIGVVEVVSPQLANFLRGEVWFMEIVFVGECEVFVCL